MNHLVYAGTERIIDKNGVREKWVSEWETGNETEQGECHSEKKSKKSIKSMRNQWRETRN